MTNTSWSHGYYTNSLYTSGFYREMAPNWLDFAALIKGHRPPRLEGEPFRYLELGSGMGLHLCLLAAAYPEGEFVGIDFHVDHIANSLQTKKTLGLENVAFIHEDILELASDVKALSVAGSEVLIESRHQYVVCHGMFSWVDPVVKSAILKAAKRFLAIGGIFYLSYNTLPGWTPNVIFHHLAEGERKRSSDAQPLQAYQRAIELLSSLIGKQDGDQSGTPLIAQQPALGQVVGEVSSIDPSYLLHEYANPNWHPLWVDDVHQGLLEYQLRFIGSANLPELFQELLPPFIKSIVDAEPESARKELCIDLALCRRFRRDLHVYGFNPLTETERIKALRQTSFRRMTSLDLEKILFPTTYGEIAGERSVYAAIDKALRESDATLEELSLACRRTIDAMPVLMALALNSGFVCLARPRYSADSMAEVNRRLIRATAHGAPFSYLAAPEIGSAVSLLLQEALLLNLLFKGVGNENLAKGLVESLEKLGQQLQPLDKTMNNGQEGLANLAVQHFMTVKRPMLRNAGIAVAGV